MVPLFTYYWFELSWPIYHDNAYLINSTVIKGTEILWWKIKICTHISMQKIKIKNVFSGDNRSVLSQSLKIKMLYYIWKIIFNFKWNSNERTEHFTIKTMLSTFQTALLINGKILAKSFGKCPWSPSLKNICLFRKKFVLEGLNFPYYYTPITSIKIQRHSLSSSSLIMPCRLLSEFIHNFQSYNFLSIFTKVQSLQLQNKNKILIKTVDEFKLVEFLIKNVKFLNIMAIDFVCDLLEIVLLSYTWQNINSQLLVIGIIHEL